MGILRLNSHCLFCRKKILRVCNGDGGGRTQGQGSSTSTNWKLQCATSLCQVLNVPPGKCSQWFLRSGYCEFCYQLLMDVKFVQASIDHLQERLNHLGQKTEALILANWKGIKQFQPSSSQKYAEALQCIGRLLEFRHSTPSPSENQRQRPPAQATSSESTRNVIKLTSMDEILSSEDDAGGGGDNEVTMIDLVSDADSLESSSLEENQGLGTTGKPSSETLHVENRRLTRGLMGPFFNFNLSEVNSTGRHLLTAEPKCKKRKTDLDITIRNANNARLQRERRAMKRTKLAVRRNELAGAGQRLWCTSADGHCKFTCLRRDYLAGHVLGVHEGDPTPFHCPNCEERFQNLRHLDSHAAKAHQVLNYKCPHCPRILTSRNNLGMHLKNVHFDLNFKHRCQICKKIHNSEEERTTHEALHDTTNPDSFPCVLCPNMFCFQLELQDHVNLRHEDEYRKYDCAVCSIKFFTREQIKRHKKRYHQERKPELFCKFPGCTHYAASPAALKIHRLTHEKAVQLKCTWPNCTRHLNGKASLKKHVRKHQVAESPSKAEFQCSICSKGFLSKGTYLIHLRYHRAERPFICDQCPSTYRSEANLFTHRQIKHGSSALDETEFTYTGKPRGQTSTTGNQDNLGPGDRSCAVCDSTKDVSQAGEVHACGACRIFFCNSLNNQNVETCGGSGNCPITLTTRTNCRPCRLQKCYAVGMNKDDFRRIVPFRTKHGQGGPYQRRPRTKLARTNSGRTAGDQENCIVCGCSRGRSTGKAFGASPCCVYCKIFFRDAVLKKRTYSCANVGECVNSGNYLANTGNYCASCRFQKCLAAGMKVEAVQAPMSSIAGDCTICNQTSVEILPSYGVRSCLNCRIFFWKTIKDDMSRVCHFGGHCNPNVRCAGCRWRKCLEAGMKPMLVKTTERPLDKNTQKKKTSQQTCDVCGDKASHKYSGGNACPACYLFFNKLERKVTVVGNCKANGACAMDMLTRIDCPPCRLQKCLSIGMRRNLQHARPKRKFHITDPCAVCGEEAKGRSYGVISCYSCMYFFMKADRRGIGHCREGGNCNIDKGNRGKCPSCRLTKCVVVGMKKVPSLRRRNGQISRTSAEAAEIRAKTGQVSSGVLAVPEAATAGDPAGLEVDPSEYSWD